MLGYVSTGAKHKNTDLRSVKDLLLKKENNNLYVGTDPPTCTAEQAVLHLHNETTPAMSPSIRL